jgi:hypothetical protein
VMVLLFCGFIFLLLLKILISFVEGHGHGGWHWCFRDVLSNYKYSSSSALCHQLHMILHAS